MGIDQISRSRVEGASAGLARAVFLDRDGVLNRNVWNPKTGEYESPGTEEEFELISGVLEALKRLQEADFLLFLVSNQPNYAKGKNSLEELKRVHAKLAKSLDGAGIRFQEFFYCLHHPDGIVPSHSGACWCRKPSPFFLKTAAADFGISLSDSWMVGDRAADIECGQAAGVRTIRVMEDHPATRKPDEPEPTFEAVDLSEAVLIILETHMPGSRAGCGATP